MLAIVDGNKRPTTQDEGKEAQDINIDGRAGSW
jgi:hypothetical protein